ncbi:MAG: Asp-tRNA(Asn)/Glu-tRNA(Gln) amidotransferase subunit GatC [Oscillospiraceae bacterium]|nr:Asp-tRNA(Asn)/Glu-tRNA(Gln) amidotransferase subunit GatC [Oscillospiraceae bacterium]
MEISKERILNLSNQIYVNLTEEEVQKLCKDVGEIAEMMQVLTEVDVSGIKADVAVLEGLHNAFRSDEVVDYEEKEALLQNAKEVEENMFKIPKIV